MLSIDRAVYMLPIKKENGKSSYRARILEIETRLRSELRKGNRVLSLSHPQKIYKDVMVLIYLIR